MKQRNLLTGAKISGRMYQGFGVMDKRVLSLMPIVILYFFVTILGAQVTPVTIGSGDQIARMPFDFYWRFSLYECIYYAREIGQPCLIEEITLYPTQNTCYVHGYPVTIWLGNTNLENLSAGWISNNDLTLVYDGYYIDNTFFSEYNMKFPEPFFYEGQNLIMLVYHAHFCYCIANYGFKAQSNVHNRARNFYSDSILPNPANPTITGNLTAMYPKITFWTQSPATLNRE